MSGWMWCWMIAAYFCGSIPFGVLIARGKGIDLRKVGSGNVGATNVVRSVGRGWGYACFLLDVLKGFAPTFLAGLLAVNQHPPTAWEQTFWLAVGVSCIFGHVFPVWLKFKGGKGVATSLGVVLGVWPYFTIPGLICFLLWVVVTKISRYVSLGSIAAAAVFVPVCFLFAVLWGDVDTAVELWPMLSFAAIMAGLIIVRHRTNIVRLLTGRENKIGAKAQTH